MDLREKLRGRPDVPDDQVDDVIELAAQLQDEARRPPDRGASVAEVQAVAAELDIAPEFVEQAITRRRDEAEQAGVAARARRQRIRKIILLCVIVDIVVFGALGLASWSGAVGLRDERAAVVEARAALETALDRQADLGTQLVALGGADAIDLDPLKERVTAADTLDGKRAAADQLATEVATRLGALPPAEHDAAARMRLNLQYEVTGSQNRVATEERRFRDAVAVYDQAASTPTAALALALGVAKDPRP
jgi:LemA protein